MILSSRVQRSVAIQVNNFSLLLSEISLPLISISSYLRSSLTVCMRYSSAYLSVFLISLVYAFSFNLYLASRLTWRFLNLLALTTSLLSSFCSVQSRFLINLLLILWFSTLTSILSLRSLRSVLAISISVSSLRISLRLLWFSKVLRFSSSNYETLKLIDS